MVKGVLCPALLAVRGMRNGNGLRQGDDGVAQFAHRRLVVVPVVHSVRLRGERRWNLLPWCGARSGVPPRQSTVASYRRLYFPSNLVAMGYLSDQ